MTDFTAHCIAQAIIARSTEATDTTPVTDWSAEDVFGIVIPGTASAIAAGFRQDQVAPTVNAQNV